jgi:formate/nitrite transporter FocA (FNT family)
LPSSKRHGGEPFIGTAHHASRRGTADHVALAIAGSWLATNLSMCIFIDATELTTGTKVQFAAIAIMIFAITDFEHPS